MSVFSERPDVHDDASLSVDGASLSVDDARLSVDPDVERRNGVAVARAAPDPMSPSAPVEVSGAYVTHVMLM